MNQRTEAGDAARCPKRATDRLTVATLNTRGLAPAGSHLAQRYRLIADSLDATEGDVVTFQEVFTYYHLRLLLKHMPSFRYASFRPSAAGPAGGLATVSRRPVSKSHYKRFPFPADMVGLPSFTRFRAALKGSLVTTLRNPRICIVNTHPLANRDGDWSESNRYYAVHKEQLAALERLIAELSLPTAVCGDFNISRQSSLFQDFVTRTGLTDAFDGQCPPTFHAQYLSAGESAHCIDFIMVTDSLKVEAHDLLFTSKQELQGGPDYLSDHIGLRVSALVAS